MKSILGHSIVYWNFFGLDPGYGSDIHVDFKIIKHREKYEIPCEQETPL